MYIPGLLRRLLLATLLAGLPATLAELAWMAQHGQRGTPLLAIVLLGANALLCAAVLGALYLAGSLVAHGYALRAGLARLRGRPSGDWLPAWTAWATVVIVAAGALGLAFATGAEWIAASIATPRFRPPLAALFSLASTIAVVAVVPGAARLLASALGRLRPAVVRGAAAALGAAVLVVVLLALYAVRDVLGENRPARLAVARDPARRGRVRGVRRAAPRDPAAARGRARPRASPRRARRFRAPPPGVSSGAEERRGDGRPPEPPPGREAPEPDDARRTGVAGAPLPGGAPPLPEPARARHLVLVTIDALRFDRSIGARGAALMPRLTALAARGTRFDAAFCAVPGSLRAIPSLLAGRYQNGLPWRRPVQVYLDAARTRILPELLAGAGFRTMFVPHSRYVLNPGTRQGFATVIDPILLPEADRRQKLPRDQAMVRATLAELARHPVRPDERLFTWSHFMDPHAPYYARPGTRTEEERYDAEVAGSDAALGELLDGLARAGVLADALVVVTADHGEEFGEHGATRHSRTLYLPAVHVPLVVVAPGLAPRVVDEVVSHIDLLPTLLDLLGLPVPGGLDGRSLAPAVVEGSPPPERTIVMVSYPMYDRVPAEYAAARGEWKLHADVAGEPTALYAWRRDPLERENLLDEAPEVVRSLAADLATLRARGLGDAR